MSQSQRLRAFQNIGAEIHRYGSPERLFAKSLWLHEKVSMCTSASWISEDFA
jgi:hypothetical protein